MRMSLLVKVTPGSRLNVKVMVVLSPAFKAAAALVMVSVGAVPLRLLATAERKKAARSPEERERMSPKPALSTPLELM